MDKLLLTRTNLQPRYAEYPLSALRIKHLKANIRRLVNQAKFINRNIDVHLIEREVNLSTTHHTRLV